MFGLGKPKYDLNLLLSRIEREMGEELAGELGVQEPQIHCITHKQGVDVVFSFIKKSRSPVRKKISHLVKLDKVLKQREEDVYKNIRFRLHELAQIRLNEMTAH